MNLDRRVQAGVERYYALMETEFGDVIRKTPRARELK